MSSENPNTLAGAESCGTCRKQGFCEGRGLAVFKEGSWTSNPVAVQTLGICPTLAVTTRLENSLVMGGAMIFVTVGSSFMLSLLRHTTPRRIRLIASVAVIATFVILIDQFLKGFYWEMSRQLGPYVGLIITNCIVLGRAEAFAMQNKPQLAVVDAFAAGLGFAGVLAVVGFFRELLGEGTVLGFTVLGPEWYTKNLVMVLAPGAFVVMGFLIAFFNWLQDKNAEKS
ncbi:MAG: electron transport complex subunit RsxE [Thermoguttaceae bacterium]|jgi:Na+-transporting NADH:ubiquinone oxidoreductase subunit D|nr:electron transport complex subunit RsxE [Thermoguttaceae bacterium]